jgi:hypothetical protein
VPGEVFGRTNQVFPPIWLSLGVPADPAEIDPMSDAAVQAGLPLDISVSPALWGGKMRGTDAIISCFSTTAFEQATDSTHAIDLIHAHLIEVLSCLGREHLDFYFLRIRRAIEEYQLAGVLEALEVDRQEGHIRFFGLACDGPPLAALSVWQFNDAFEAVYCPDRGAGETLVPLARERRVGVLWGDVSPLNAAANDARLLSVTSAAGIFEALA